MYNRYIPQPDGSYRRDRVREPKQAIKPTAPVPPPKSAPVPEPCCPPPEPAPACAPPTKSQKHTPPCRAHTKEPGSLGGFFKQLLPKDLDTADLLIIILLLLMAGDNEENQTNALLTLALYFFM